MSTLNKILPRRCRVFAPEEVTTHGEERCPEDVGVPRAQVEKIWSSVVT